MGAFLFRLLLVVVILAVEAFVARLMWFGWVRDVFPTAPALTYWQVLVFIAFVRWVVHPIKVSTTEREG